MRSISAIMTFFSYVLLMDAYAAMSSDKMPDAQQDKETVIKDHLTEAPQPLASAASFNIKIPASETENFFHYPITSAAYFNVHTKTVAKSFKQAGSGQIIKYYVTKPSKVIQGRNPVLFLTGKGGCAEDPHYQNAIIDFSQENGVEVYAFDWPYQGNSSKHQENEEAVHIHSFIEYKMALKAFIQVIMKDHNKKDGIDVMAISMGGCNILNYSQENKENLPFRKIIALAPMVSFKTPVPSPVARLTSNLFHYLGFGSSFALGQESLRSKNRPDGVTYSWIAAAYEAAAKLNPVQLSIPVMMVVPKKDKVVPVWDQIQFASKIEAIGSKTVVLEDYPHDVLYTPKHKQKPLLTLFSKYFYEENEIKEGKDKTHGVTIYDIGFNPKPYDPDAVSEEEEDFTTVLGIIATMATGLGD